MRSGIKLIRPCIVHTVRRDVYFMLPFEYVLCARARAAYGMRTGSCRAEWQHAASPAPLKGERAGAQPHGEALLFFRARSSWPLPWRRTLRPTSPPPMFGLLKTPLESADFCNLLNSPSGTSLTSFGRNHQNETYQNDLLETIPAAALRALAQTA